MKRVFLVTVIILIRCSLLSAENAGIKLVKPLSPGEYTLQQGSILQRPILQTSIISPSGFFRIHFDTSGINVPQYDLNEFALAADSSLEIITNSFSFSPPPDDGINGGDSLYDIYITYLPGLYGETDFETPLGNDMYTTYILINNNFGPGYYTHGIDAARVAIASEVTHAILVGNYPYHEDNIFYYFITSTAMEEYIFDYVNDYYGYIGSYFLHPNKSFSQYYGYELSIWHIYLRDRFGNYIIKKIWDNIFSLNIIEAMDAAINEYGSSLKDEFSNFGIWTYYTGDRAIYGKYFEEAANYPILQLSGTVEIIVPETVITIPTFPLSNNIILLNDNRPGLQNQILVIICNHDKINAAFNPNYEMGVEYHFLTFDEDSSIKISDEYWYYIMSSANENIQVLHLINDQITSVDNGNYKLQYYLSQNYPNPFNPSTKIQYSIPEAGFVSMIVYNILGQEIIRLVNDYVNTGVHQIDFNASSLAAGVYYYELKADDKIIVKKMMLLR